MQFEFGYLQEPRPRMSRAWLLCCAIVVLSVLGVRVAGAQVPRAAQATRAEIRVLLRLNGSEGTTAQLGPAMADSVIAALHKTNPGLSASAEAAVRHAVEAYVRDRAEHDKVVNLLIPIYAKHFDQDEIERLISFYRTPAGQELARATPAISFESSNAGQQWAESIAPGLRLKLLDVLRKQNLIQ